MIVALAVVVAVIVLFAVATAAIPSAPTNILSPPTREQT